MTTMTRCHQVEGLSFDTDSMNLTIDGKTYTFPINIVSETLSQATLEQRMTFEISDSGYGIHWPLIDEDLSVDGLVRTATSIIPNKP